jgi:hypothetical protein
MPVCKTNRIPSSAFQSERRRLPPGRLLFGFGSRGSKISQNSSETLHGGACLTGISFSLTMDADDFDLR